MTVEAISVGLFNLAIAGILGQLIYSKRQDKKKLDETHDKVIRLEERNNTMVSDIHEIKGDTREIKKVVTALQVSQAQK